jgi:hypothetical protein
LERCQIRNIFDVLERKLNPLENKLDQLAFMASKNGAEYTLFDEHSAAGGLGERDIDWPRQREGIMRSL